MKRHYLNYKNSKVKSQNFKIPDFKIPAAAIFFKKIAAASSITNYHSEHFIFCHSVILRTLVRRIPWLSLLTVILSVSEGSLGF